jgi:hypothetical protein
MQCRALVCCAGQPFTEPLRHSKVATVCATAPTPPRQSQLFGDSLKLHAGSD